MNALLKFALGALLCCVILTSPARAQCVGSDLRPTLPDAVSREVAGLVADTPYPRGNHWLATRGSRSVRVIGTFHMDDPRMPKVVARLTPVIETADVLLVEAAPDDQAVFEAKLAKDPALLLRPTGPTLPDLLDEDTWQALADAARARNLPVIMAAKMQPWFLSMMLSLPPCAMAQLQANAGGLDAALTDIALAADVPVDGLEHPEDVMRGINALDLDTQLDLLVWSLVTQDQADDIFVTLREGYFDEEHAFIWHFGGAMARTSPLIDAAELDATMSLVSDVLLERRNIAWMDVIANAPGQQIVVAVGAAHLFGQNGVLALLKGQGYTLSRQPF